MSVRIGTWNLAGRWGARYQTFLASLRCDLLLLTEVADDVELPTHGMHRTGGRMATGRAWSAVACANHLGWRPLTDPHGASAAVDWDGWTVCSSVLPWRTCGSGAPWSGPDTTARTLDAVAAVEAVRPTIWGGDWNHSLDGPERAGSRGGRAAILASMQRLSLEAGTQRSPHRLGHGTLTIDHIATPRTWTTDAVEAHDAESLSDHDAYVVEVRPAASAVRH